MHKQSNLASLTNKKDHTLRSRAYRIGRGSYSGFMIFLFLLMAAYLALPIVDVPVMGLSLSAPIFALIALQALLAPPEPWFKKFQGWILLAGLIWLGVFISIVGNGLLSGGVKIDREGALSILQYAYWLLLFIVTAYFVSRENLLERVCGVLGWAVFGLALIRLFEAAAWGRVGASAGSRLLTPNSYGLLFSLFFPYLLAPILSTRGPKKLLMILRMLAASAAVIINGSRSSWISVVAGILLFSLLLLLVSPKKIGGAVLVIGLSILVLAGLQLAPDRVSAAFGQRFATFEKLEADKSFMFRQIMVQKGLRLFEESPLIGVGASRFRKESAELELTGVFAYYPQSRFENKSPHNSYIAFLAETGLAGSLPLAVLLLVLSLGGLKSSLVLARRQQVWALSVYTGFIGMSIHMWSISTLTNTANWFAYGLVAAMIVSARVRQI